MIQAATVAGFLESTYLVEDFGLSTKYVEELRRVVKQLDRHAGHAIVLYELSSRLISGFLASLLAAGYSPTTVNNKRRMLLTVWREAYRRKLASRPQRIKRLTEPDPNVTAWVVGECERIFARCAALKGSVAGIPRRDWRLSLFVTIYWVGERVGAVRNSLTENCDLTAGTLRITWRIHKTRKGRTLILPPQAIEIIRLIYDPSRRELWPWPHDSRHFFRQARRIIESAGVPCPKEGKGLFQRLRRTSGSYVEANGGDGARHLGNTRKVFERHYMAPSLCGRSQVLLIPSPNLSLPPPAPEWSI